eukprot:g2022.t1
MPNKNGMLEEITSKNEGIAFHVSASYVFYKSYTKKEQSYKLKNRIVGSRTSAGTDADGTSNTRIKDTQRYNYSSSRSYFFKARNVTFGMVDQIELADCLLTLKNEDDGMLLRNEANETVIKVFKNDCFCFIFSNLNLYTKLKLGNSNVQAMYDACMEEERYKHPYYRTTMQLLNIVTAAYEDIWYYTTLPKIFVPQKNCITLDEALVEEEKQLKKKEQVKDVSPLPGGKPAIVSTEDLHLLYNTEESRDCLHNLMKVANDYCSNLFKAASFNFDMKELVSLLLQVKPAHYLVNYLSWCCQTNQRGVGRHQLEYAAVIHLLAIGVNQSRNNAQNFMHMIAFLNYSLGFGTTACSWYSGLGLGTSFENTKMLMEKRLKQRGVAIKFGSHLGADNAQQIVHINGGEAVVFDGIGLYSRLLPYYDSHVKENHQLQPDAAFRKKKLTKGEFENAQETMYN